MLRLLPVVLLLGCASSRWAKDGASNDDFADDKQYCALYAQRLNENYTATRGFTSNALFSQCMQERGWSQVR